jgi:hypothetical protein
MNECTFKQSGEQINLSKLKRRRFINENIDLRFNKLSE